MTSTHHSNSVTAECLRVLLELAERHRGAPWTITEGLRRFAYLKVKHDFVQVVNRCGYRVATNASCRPTGTVTYDPFSNTYTARLTCFTPILAEWEEVFNCAHAVVRRLECADVMLREVEWGPPGPPVKRTPSE